MRLAARVQDTTVAALFMAGGYSVIAVVLRALGGGRVLDQAGVGLLELIGWYFGAAILAGPLVGLLLPLGRRPLGGAIVGLVAGLVVFAPGVSLFGRFAKQLDGRLIVGSGWDVLAVTALCAACVGVPVGYKLSHAARRGRK